MPMKNSSKEVWTKWWPKHPCDYVNPRLTVCYRLFHSQKSCSIGRFPSNQVNSKCIQNCQLTVFSSKNFRIVIEFRKNNFELESFELLKFSKIRNIDVTQFCSSNMTNCFIQRAHEINIKHFFLNTSKIANL